MASPIVRHSPPRADTSLCGLIGALAAFHAPDAMAGTDPFALPPPDPSKPSPENTLQRDIIYADVTVNGVAKSRLVQLRETSDGLAIRNSDAVFLGLEGAKGAEEGFTALARLSGVTARYQAHLTRLDLTVLRKSDGPNAVNMRPSRGDTVIEGRPLSALIIDYDAAVTADRRGTAAAALLGARFARGALSIDSAWQVNTRPQTGVKNAVRLDTSLSYLSRAGDFRATLGDFVATAPASGRSVRMGGLRLSTDFSARPDLVTYPLPSFDGSTAVPTGLDLVVNDRRYTAGAIEPGEFAVRNVPVPVGRNQIGVIVRNALGQEQVQTVSVYTSRSLLAPGLGVSSLNLGYLRRNFGRISDDYGPFAMTGGYRRGLSPNVTGEASFEAARGFWNLGANVAFTLGNFALATMDVRASRNERAPLMPGQPERRGHLWAFGLESFGRPVSFAVQATRVSRHYDDLASATGDPAPFSRFSASANFDLGKVGQLNLVAIRQRRAARVYGPVNEPAQRSTIVTASYRTQVRGRFNLFADLSYSRDDRSSLALLLGVSMQFGARTTAQASASFTGGRADYQAMIQRADPLPGDTGYRMTVGTGFIDRAGVGVSHHATWGRSALEAEAVAGHVAARATVNGSLVLADKTLFATNRLSSGFAVVRTGKVGDVAVLRENRFAGKTNAAGKLLVTELPAYVPVKVSLDAETLPGEATIHKDRAHIAAPDRGGTLIDLNVERVRPVMMRLLTAAGEPVSAGTQIKSLPSGAISLVGFDGMAEINALAGDREIRIETGAGGVCFASLPDVRAAEAYAHIGDIHCNAQIRPPALASLGRAGF